MTAQEIADLIDRLKGHFVLTVVGLPLAVSPEVERLLADSGVSLETDPIRLRRRDSPDYTLPIQEVVEGAQHDKARQMAVVDSWLELAVIRVAAVLEENKYFDKAPVLVFLRHVRNGLAHGNRFDPKSGPYWLLDARFGRLTITKDTSGRVMGSGGLLKRGDVLALLDEVAAHLRTDPPPKSHSEAKAAHGSP